MYNEENRELLGNQFLEKNYDISDYIWDKFNYYKNINKAFFICIFFLIVIYSYVENNFFDYFNSVFFHEGKPDFDPLEKLEPINYYVNESDIVNLYIITHKDFKADLIKNPNYKILCDNISQIKQKYNLEIIPTNSTDNIFYPKRIGYGENSKMYYIWNLYKSGNLTSKYVGFFHYKRIFEFENNIPDLDLIFQKYDVILPTRLIIENSMYENFGKWHIMHFLNDAINIVGKKFPDYYLHTKRYLRKNWGHFYNIFIMKKEDFIEWGEFVFGVLLEFDKKYNLKTDADTKNLMRKEIEKYKTNMDVDYQSRLQGFIIERLSNIFFDKSFKERYELNLIDITKNNTN